MTDEPTDLISKIRDNVKLRRSELDLTAKDLAERLQAVGSELDYGVLANFEAGRRQSLSVQEFAELAMALDTTPAELIDWWDPRNRGDEVTVGNSTENGRAWRLFFAGDASFDSESGHLQPTRSREAFVEEVAALMQEIEDPVIQLSDLFRSIQDKSADFTYPSKPTDS